MMKRAGGGGGGEGRGGARRVGVGGMGAEGGEGRRAARRLSSEGAKKKKYRNIEILLVKPEGAGMGAKRGKLEGLLAAYTANFFGDNFLDFLAFDKSGLRRH